MLLFTHECPVCGFEDRNVSMVSMFVDGHIVCPQCGYDGPDDVESDDDIETEGGFYYIDN